MKTIAFEPWPKIARLSREIIITEKLDGTNASILIAEGKDDPKAICEWFDEETRSDMVMLAGSRTRWITPQDDNFGFARWASENHRELMKLGAGHHFGEWWGQGIQRNYGLKEKRFSLFNTTRWAENRPTCCSVVPELYRGGFHSDAAHAMLELLRDEGSVAAPGFMKPEGIVVFHTAANIGFKKTLEKDEQPKGIQ